MPNLTVSLPLWIVSQIFMFVALVVIVISLQVRNKRKLLLLQSFSCLLYCINLALLQNWIVFITLFVALVRNIVFAYLEYRNEQGKSVPSVVGWSIVMLFVPLLIVPTIFLWEWWFDWVLVLTSIPLLIGAYVKGTHFLRTGIIMKASLNIVNAVFFFNIVAIVAESIVVTSIFIFYGRFFIAKSKAETENKEFAELGFDEVISESAEEGGPPSGT